MKAAFMLNARDKAKHVEFAARSMFLQQDCTLEILLSDQGSKDGTAEILDRVAAEYSGPHTVRRLNCPPEVCAPRGMPGLNAHINWAMTQTDADVILQLSADDYALPGRAAAVLRAFEAHKPSMVLTGMYYVNEDCKYLAESAWPDKDGWCLVEEMFPKAVGGSASQAWTHEFFDKLGGLQGVGSQDVIMPFLACLDKGAYYLRERLHCYRKVVDPKNTGLEGVYYAYPEGHPMRLQLEELMHFQVMAGMYACLGAAQRLGLMTEAANAALANAILDRSASWCATRQNMSFAGVAPLPFRTS